MFAFWAAREGVDAGRVVSILRRSYESGRERFEDLVRGEAEETGLSAAVIEDYLRHSLHYELEASDRQGLDLYYRLAAEEGLIASVRRLEEL